MTNYSKWDKFAADLASSDEEGDGAGLQPTVTRVGGNDGRGQRVHIGPDGYSFEKEEEEGFPLSSGSVCQERAQTGKEPATPSSYDITPSATQAKSGETELSHIDASETRNGAKCEKYSWNQNRYDVMLTIDVDQNAKAKDIRLHLEENRQFTIMLYQNSHTESALVLLSGRLRYLVEVLEDEKDGVVYSPFDWEIRQKSPTRRVIEVVIIKKSPIPGAFIWWENVFEGERGIDVMKIEGRNVSRAAMASDSFVAAQKQFVANAATREKIEVDF